MAAVSLTKANNGQSIEVRQGDEIILRLPENPTTGYGWHIDRADGLSPETVRAHDGLGPAGSEPTARTREAFGSFGSGPGSRGRGDWN